MGHHIAKVLSLVTENGEAKKQGTLVKAVPLTNNPVDKFLTNSRTQSLKALLERANAKGLREPEPQ